MLQQGSPIVIDRLVMVQEVQILPGSILTTSICSRRLIGSILRSLRIPCQQLTKELVLGGVLYAAKCLDGRSPQGE